eukprot:scaffold261544_cov28-Tisochrysis_lutea.AAC.1
MKRTEPRSERPCNIASTTIRRSNTVTAAGGGVPSRPASLTTASQVEIRSTRERKTGVTLSVVSCSHKKTGKSWWVLMFWCSSCRTSTSRSCATAAACARSRKGLPPLSASAHPSASANARPSGMVPMANVSSGRCFRA